MDFLSLYGGKTEVLKRMTKMFVESLRELPLGEVEFWQESLNIPVRLVDTKIDDAENGNFIDYDLFSILSGPLSIDTIDVLGEPDFSVYSEEKYEQDKNEHPFFVFGLEDQNVMDKETYVFLRAIQELKYKGE